MDIPNIIVERSKLSNNYEYLVAKHSQYAYDAVAFTQNKACVFVFDMDDSHKVVSSIYLMKHYDAFREVTKRSVFIANVDPALDETGHAAAVRYLNQTLQIPKSALELRDTYYIGSLDFNLLLVGSMPCYAFDITGRGLDLNGREINSELHQYIERAPFTALSDGSTYDCMVSACMHMLLAYFS